MEHLQGHVDEFGQLLPLLEFPSGGSVADQGRIFQNVFGRAYADNSTWKLLTRELKWGAETS